MKNLKIKIPTDLPHHAATFLARVERFAELNIPNATVATMVEKGVITLLLPDYWNKLSEDCQRELLSHEAAHWGFGHHQRTRTLLKSKYGNLESKEPLHIAKLQAASQKFNMVCDCAIKHNGSEDHLITEAELSTVLNKPIESPTYERLGLPPCPPEIAYEMLPETEVQYVSCGSLSNFKMDGSQESQDAIELVGMEVGMVMPNSSRSAGIQPGPGLAVPEIPPLPKWIREVLDLLWHRTARVDRGKSWRRHSKVSELLPGNTLTDSLDVRVMLDASGSVFTPELLGQFLSVLANTPELKHSDVVVFDAEVAPPVLIADYKKVIETVSHKGGGTLIAQAGKAREAGRPVIWLTDGCSADGFPEPHGDLEIWVVPQDGQVPKGQLVVRMLS